MKKLFPVILIMAIVGGWTAYVMSGRVANSDSKEKEKVAKTSPSSEKKKEDKKEASTEQEEESEKKETSRKEKKKEKDEDQEKEKNKKSKEESEKESQKKAEKKKKKKKKTFFVDAKKKIIRIKGYITIQKGLIEVFACTPKGKRHESVMVILCTPKMIQFWLLAFGLKANRNVKKFGQGGELKGDKVYLYVRWKDPKTGQKKIYRGEDLVYNSKTKKTMKRVGWVFTGSRFRKQKFSNLKGEVKEREIYMANYTGNVIATYRDPDSILNIPLKAGGDDTVYYSNYIALPKRGHPAELIICVKPNPKWDKLSEPYDYEKEAKKLREKKRAQDKENDKEKEEKAKEKTSKEEESQ